MYASTHDQDDEEIEKIYNDMKQVMVLTKNQDNTIIMGILMLKRVKEKKNLQIGNFGPINGRSYNFARKIRW